MSNINLHTHTNFSDGLSSIQSYAIKAKELNHAALVITDHDYMKMSVDKYNSQLREAERVSDIYEIPIICGLEISLWFEEALLFNKDACLDWLSYRPKMIYSEKMILDFPIEQTPLYIKEIKQKYDCALVLCHPDCSTNWNICMHEYNVYSLMDGYEISNHGIMWPQSSIEWMEVIMPTAKQFKNYDAHIVDHFSGVCNEINIEIKNENDLINWVKGGR